MFKVTRTLHDGKIFEETVHSSLEEARAKISAEAADIFRTAASRDADYQKLQESIATLEVGQSIPTMPGYRKCSSFEIEDTNQPKKKGWFW